MATKKVQFMEIGPKVVIPPSNNLTPGEEAAIVAQARDQFDSSASAKDLASLLVQRQQGLLVSGEGVLTSLEALESLEMETKKESA